MKLLTATVVLAFAFAGTAQAHTFTFHPSLAKRSLAARAAGQHQILRHDRSVLRSTAWLARTDSREPLTDSSARLLAMRNFHAAQSRWVRRELRQTVGLIRAQARRQRASLRRALHNWLSAVDYVQPAWPGSKGWLRSCSATGSEGGWGRWFPNTQGSGAGGWLQFMLGTFDSHVDGAFAYGRARGLYIPRSARSWYSPLGQAATGAEMLRQGQTGQWTGAGC